MKHVRFLTAPAVSVRQDSDPSSASSAGAGYSEAAPAPTCFRSEFVYDSDEEHRLEAELGIGCGARTGVTLLGGRLLAEALASEERLENEVARLHRLLGEKHAEVHILRLHQVKANEEVQAVQRSRVLLLQHVHLAAIGTKWRSISAGIQAVFSNCSASAWTSGGKKTAAPRLGLAAHARKFLRIWSHHAKRHCECMARVECVVRTVRAKTKRLLRRCALQEWRCAAARCSEKVHLSRYVASYVQRTAAFVLSVRRKYLTARILGDWKGHVKTLRKTLSGRKHLVQRLFVSAWIDWLKSLRRLRHARQQMAIRIQYTARQLCHDVILAWRAELLACIARENSLVARVRTTLAGWRVAMPMRAFAALASYCALNKIRRNECAKLSHALNSFAQAPRGLDHMLKRSLNLWRNACKIRWAGHSLLSDNRGNSSIRINKEAVTCTERSKLQKSTSRPHLEEKRWAPMMTGWATDVIVIAKPPISLSSPSLRSKGPSVGERFAADHVTPVKVVSAGQNGDWMRGNRACKNETGNASIRTQLDFGAVTSLSNSDSNGQDGNGAFDDRREGLL